MTSELVGSVVKIFNSENFNGDYTITSVETGEPTMKPGDKVTILNQYNNGYAFIEGEAVLLRCIREGTEGGAPDRWDVLFDGDPSDCAVRRFIYSEQEVAEARAFWGGYEAYLTGGDNPHTKEGETNLHDSWMYGHHIAEQEDQGGGA